MRRAWHGLKRTASCLRHRGGGGNETPPSMHRSRCLGWTSEDTREGGETARTGSVFLHASSELSFLGFSSDASQTRFRLLFFTFSTREICFVPSGHPLKTRTLYQIAALPIKRGVFGISMVTRQSECTPSAKRGLHSLCRFDWLH